MSVTGQTAEGMGPSKKVAKRNAAEKMLELLGYKVPQPQPPKPALKTEEKVPFQMFTRFYSCVRFLHLIQSGMQMENVVKAKDYSKYHRLIMDFVDRDRFI